ncbi:MAG TPA: glycosyltransferase [bacterium]|nr:glycosyltransferase [bacterium]HPN43230.1 glycosyltransferase [bacterium]
MKNSVNTPTLSLCMIVKNEEKFLPQCLESVQGVVDEIVIVDTGSTDRTVEIATRYNARVYHHPWEGNFSKARNISLSYATCDWILVIDADEKLERADIPLLKYALQSDKYNVIFCSVISASPSGDSKNYSHRIFRRDKGHYEGIVHNQLIHEGAWLHTDIRIYHYGYNLSPEEMQAKYRRTEVLLKQQLDEDQTNPFAWQNYLRILRVQHHYQEAIESGFRALEISKDRMDELNYQMICGDMIFAMLSLQHYADAEKLIRKVLAVYPQNLDINFSLGLALQGLQRYRDAIDAMMNFISLNREFKKNPQHTRVIIDTFDFEHRAWGNISDCYFYLHEMEKALEAIDKAIAIQPEIPVYTTARARILIELNRAADAEKSLIAFEQRQPLSALFYEKWAGLCLAYPHFSDLNTVIEKGLTRFNDSVELRNLYAGRLAALDINKAEEQWQLVLENSPVHLGAILGLAAIYKKKNDRVTFQKMVDLVLENAKLKEPLKQIGEYCLSMGLYEKAIEVYSRYLTFAPTDVNVLNIISSCYANLKQYRSAFTGFTEILKLDPGNVQALHNLKVLQQILQNDHT